MFALALDFFLAFTFYNSSFFSPDHQLHLHRPTSAGIGTSRRGDGELWRSGGVLQA